MFILNYNIVYYKRELNGFVIMAPQAICVFGGAKVILVETFCKKFIVKNN